jgi:hypothetical protein
MSRRGDDGRKQIERGAFRNRRRVFPALLKHHYLFT